MILAIKTDGAMADLILLSPAGQELEWENWESGRQLADGILDHVSGLLRRHDAAIDDLTGIVVFGGPGSFTSLRIGITVANTLAHSLRSPLVSAEGDGWLQAGLAELPKAKPAQIVLPIYDREPNITKPQS